MKELIIMARKPLEESTIVKNVLKYGTGGINIDGCRVGTEEIATGGSVMDIRGKLGDQHLKNRINIPVKINTGRFPANTIFDEEAGKLLDEQSGTETSTKWNKTYNDSIGGVFAGGNMNEGNSYGDKGGASRFFYNPDKDNNINKRINNMNIDLRVGDSLQVLKELEANSVDSIVTDPPYGISFMGKQWDYDVPQVALWKEALRVLKPGGYLLSFAGTRTQHRMAVNIEDAGFEIRDMISWIYGSGFPKSHNIGKSVDKLQGNDREVTGTMNVRDIRGDGYSSEISGERDRIDHPLTKGNSRWEGWGTALKPSNEPITVARKPLGESTVAKNVLKYGTGGINIDGCRIGTEEIEISNGDGFANSGIYGGGINTTTKNTTHTGRFPANTIFDEEAGKLLDEQSGDIKGGKNMKPFMSPPKNDINLTSGNKIIHRLGYEDDGGASRFFYCPKASKTDRNEGCDELEANIMSMFAGDDGKKGLGRSSFEGNEYQQQEVTPHKNDHPTVKPTKLMQYLVRLVTPKDGTVLDPFMGSGSTGKACALEGFNFIGIDLDKEYVTIARERIKYALSGKNEVIVTESKTIIINEQHNYW